jgi:hypothetical protein
MGQWTIVIHGTGAHHNWATTPDPTKPDGSGYEFITGRKNDFDADLLFAEFVDKLRAAGHALGGTTFTYGGMHGDDAVIRADYQNPHLEAARKEPGIALEPEPAAPPPFTEQQVAHMRDRFLSWRLPENFRPDCGIHFDADAPLKLSPHNRRYEPTGTNLFDADQATEMVRHMLGGLPA